MTTAQGQALTGYCDVIGQPVTFEEQDTGIVCPACGAVVDDTIRYVTQPHWLDES